MNHIEFQIISTDNWDQYWSPWQNQEVSTNHQRDAFWNESTHEVMGYGPKQKNNLMDWKCSILENVFVKSINKNLSSIGIDLRPQSKRKKKIKKAHKK